MEIPTRLTDSITIRGEKYTFKFDDDTHKYFINGKEYPSVTQVMKEFGFSRGLKYVKDLDFYSDRGRAVHLCCEYDDQNDLNEEAADDLMPYVEGWRKFKESVGLKHVFIEYPIFSPTHKYAGRIDRVSLIEDDEAKKSHTIIDIKHGQVGHSAEIQLGGYRLGMIDMFLFNGEVNFNCIAVQLFNTGKFKIHRFDRDKGTEQFLHFVSSYSYMAKHGMLTMGGDGCGEQESAVK